MKPGPKPIPANLRLVLGTRTRKDRERPANPPPEPPVRIPSPPDYLADEEVDVFVTMARKLAGMRIMTELDVDALALYCRSWAEMQKLQQMIRDSGFLLKSPTGRPMRNPLVEMRNERERTCLRIMADFGLNPSSRNRVSQ